MSTRLTASTGRFVAGLVLLVLVHMMTTGPTLLALAVLGLGGLLATGRPLTTGARLVAVGLLALVPGIVLGLLLGASLEDGFQDGPLESLTFAPGLHYCSLAAEPPTESAWIGFLASPCISDHPTADYVEATDWGITGAGLTAIVDRCAETPTILLWPDASYSIRAESAPFEVYQLTSSEAYALKPLPECHVVLNGRGYWRSMVETNPAWETVLKIEV